MKSVSDSASNMAGLLVGAVYLEANACSGVWLKARPKGGRGRKQHGGQAAIT